MSGDEKVFYAVQGFFGAVLVTALYFVIEAIQGRKKLLVNIALAAVSSIAIFVTAYTPRPALRENTPMLLVAVAIAMLGCDIYITLRAKWTQQEGKRYKPRTNSEIRTFNAMQNQFDNNFSFAVKVALNIIYERAYVSPENLKTQMLTMDFGRDLDEFVVQRIQKMDREFVDLTPDGHIRPNVGRSDMVTELLRRFKRDAF